MAEPDALSGILDTIRDYPERLKALREVLLANAVMLGEIPAPTYGEETRMRHICDRFTESDLCSISYDEAGNASAIIPGKNKNRNILVLAHADTVFPASEDHTVTVGVKHISGAGIADNGLGLAGMLTLPAILEELGIELDANLILLAASKSLGPGDLEGLRFFVKNIPHPIEAAICLEGAQLGRLSYNSLGMARGKIGISVSEIQSWESYGAQGAVVALNKVISQILAIPVPSEPITSIILGSVEAGKTYNTPPISATLRFEVRSEQEGMASSVREQITSIVEELHAENDVSAELNILARRTPGGIPFTHPLVNTTHRIMKALDIETKIAPSVGDLSALIAANIPAVTLGLTRATNLHETNESADIEPLFTGLAQIVGVLQAIDGGFCHEED